MTAKRVIIALLILILLGAVLTVIYRLLGGLPAAGQASFLALAGLHHSLKIELDQPVE